MNKGTICLGVGIVIVIIIFLFGFGGGDNNELSDDTVIESDNIIEEPTIFYDNYGKLYPKSSDLTLYYNNDPSIYGYFDSYDNFLGIAFYNDAKVEGKLKFNLSKVKWEDNDYKDYAKKNFTRDFKAKFKEDKDDIYAELEFLDKKGNPVDLYDLSTETGTYFDNHGNYTYVIDKQPLKLYLKGDILTIKAKHRFTVNSTPIENAPPYDGDLSKEPSDFDKTYQAVLTIKFDDSDYSYKLNSTIKGDDFAVVHT
jgi:hypothetical protein